MAESIIIHFSESKPEMTSSVLDEIGEHIGETWSIPSNEDYQIMIYLYDNFSTEYEKSEKEEVIKILGCVPKLSYCIEMRRSMQNEACDLSKKILNENFSELDFVVDDCLDKIWTKSQIALSQNLFLKEYYY